MRTIITKSRPLELLQNLLHVNVVHQIGMLMIIPIATRNWTPTEFGQYLLFIGILNITRKIFALRYDAAIIACNSVDRKKLVTVSLMFITINCLLLTTTLSVFEFTTIHIGLFLGLCCFVSSIYTLLYWVLVALEVSNDLRTAKIIELLAFSASIFVFWGISYGLIFAHTAALIVACLFIFIRNRDKVMPLAITKDLLEVLITNKRYPIFSLPTSLFDVLSNRSIIIIISSLFDVKSAGIWGAASKVLSLPSAAAGEVLSTFNYRYIANTKSVGTIKSFLLLLNSIVIIFATIFFGVLYFYGDIIVPIILGHGWIEAANLVQVLSLAFLTYFVANLFSVTLQSTKYSWILMVMNLIKFISFISIPYTFNNSLSLLEFSQIYSGIVIIISIFSIILFLIFFIDFRKEKIRVDEGS